MEVYTSEHDQAEAIKKWWEKNWKNTIFTAIVVVAAVFGGNRWTTYKDAQSSNASAQYEFMLANIQNGKLDDALDQGAQLIGQFQNTPYATLAALASAKVKLEQGDSVAAKAHLQWALDNTSDPVYKNISHMRMARILLQDGEYDKALEFINNAGDQKNYTSAIEELKGDIFAAKGDVKQAQLAYKKAINEATPNSGNKTILQMKLDDLNENNVTIEADA